MIPTTYVDWHCKSCKYEHESESTSLSYPVKCPSCGEESTTHGFFRLPENVVYFDSEPQSYNYINLEDKKVQIYIHAMTGERCNTLIYPEDMPYPDEDPIDIVRYLIKKTWDREKLNKILTVMEQCKEKSDKNKRHNRMHELRKSIVFNSSEYRSLLEEMDT